MRHGVRGVPQHGGGEAVDGAGAAARRRAKYYRARHQGTPGTAVSDWKILLFRLTIENKLYCPNKRVEFGTGIFFNIKVNIITLTQLPTSWLLILLIRIGFQTTAPFEHRLEGIGILPSHWLASPVAVWRAYLNFLLLDDVSQVFSEIRAIEPTDNFCCVLK